MSNDHIALVDLDGTLADYDHAMRAAMLTLESPGEPPFAPRTAEEAEPRYLEARRRLVQSQPGFWRNLEPIANGFRVVDKLRELGFDLHVLTKGPRTTPSAWSEKVEWCHAHVPDATIHISGDKSLVYGRVLVDDYPPYFTKWLEVRPRGLVVCVAQPWNAPWKSGAHANVIRYDGTNDDEVTDALRRAYDRGPNEALRPSPSPERPL